MKVEKINHIETAIHSFRIKDYLDKNSDLATECLNSGGYIVMHPVLKGKIDIRQTSEPATTLFRGFFGLCEGTAEEFVDKLVGWDLNNNRPDNSA